MRFVYNNKYMLAYLISGLVHVAKGDMTKSVEKNNN